MKQLSTRLVRPFLCVLVTAACLWSAGALACPAWTGNGTHVVRRDDTSLEVRTLGAGAPVIFVPSIGRGVSDFDRLAADVAAAGYLAVLPDPRGIDGSEGPMRNITLSTLAQDVLNVVRSACAGPAVVVGHALGGRIAARAAAMSPGEIKRIVLLAVSAPGPIAPALKDALGGSVAQGFKSQDARLSDLEKAYFAPGNDARAWLDGWHPFVASAQNRASVRSDREDWSAVTTPTLVLWGEADVVGTWADAQDMAHAAGDRMTLVRVPRAGRALLPEQPKAVAAAVIAYLKETKTDYNALVRNYVSEPRADARKETAVSPPPRS